MTRGRRVCVIVVCVAALAVSGVAGYRHFAGGKAYESTSENAGAAPPAVDLTHAETAVAEVIRAATDAVRATPDAHAAWGRLGMALHIHGFDREAAACYARAAELNVKEYRWRYLLGLVLRKTDLEQAIVHYRAALASSPDDPAVEVRLGEALLSLQRADDARAHFERAAKLDPACSHALLGLARIMLADGNAAGAVETLENAAALDDDHGAVFSTLAQARARLGDEVGATQAAAIAARLTPEGHLRDLTYSALIGSGVSAQWCNYRGNRLLTSGRYREAAGEYRRAVMADPKGAAFWLNFGRALGMAGAALESIAAYEKGFALQEPDAFHRTHYGMMLCKIGRTEDGMTAFREALAVDPAFPETYLQMSAVFSAGGRDHEAIEALRAGAANAPKDVKLAAALAWALATHPDDAIRKGDEALQHANRACELSQRKDAHAVAALAAALAEIGRFDEARQAVTEALALVEGAAATEEVTQDLRGMLSMFTNRQAYRDPRE